MKFKNGSTDSFGCLGVAQEVDVLGTLEEDAESHSISETIGSEDAPAVKSDSVETDAKNTNAGHPELKARASIVAGSFETGESKPASEVSEPASELSESRLDKPCNYEKDSQLAQDEISEKSAADTLSAGNHTLPQQSCLGDRPSSNVSLRDEEQNTVGAEMLFPRMVSPLAFSGWDNLRWMSYSGARKVQYCVQVDRYMTSEKKGFNLFGLGTSSAEVFVPRKLVIYEEPRLILLLRSPDGPEELRGLLDLPEGATVDNDQSMNSFLVVEAAMEPISCKLRLSPLTTPTSITEEDTKNLSSKRCSCLSLITPLETLTMTPITGEQGNVSYTDSKAFLETTTTELAISKAIFQSHNDGKEHGSGTDMSWKHQQILGTLHSDIILGSQKLLEMAILTAMKRSKENVVSHGGKVYLHTRLIDKVDDMGLTPLHYACFRRFHVGVADLVNAGARVDIRAPKLEMAPVHICAKNLDHKSLSMILSATYPVKPNPNLLDAIGRTPMYIAAIEGQGPAGGKDPHALGRCIMALEAWGGLMLPDPTASQLRWPQSVLAAGWQARELSEVLHHSATRYPLPDELLKQQMGTSIGAFYHYPIHWALISLLKETQAFYNQKEGTVLCGAYEYTQENKVAG